VIAVPSPVTIWLDGQPHEVMADIPLGAALHRLCGGRLRLTAKRRQPRGLFCGLGTCFDCLVTIDGTPDRRACLVATREGMQVSTLPKPPV
jgi:D-hydroxyproline dehydrogenase subunit gamma